MDLNPIPRKKLNKTTTDSFESNKVLFLNNVTFPVTR